MNLFVLVIDQHFRCTVKIFFLEHCIDVQISVRVHTTRSKIDTMDSERSVNNVLLFLIFNNFPFFSKFLNRKLE